MLRRCLRISVFCWVSYGVHTFSTGASIFFGEGAATFNFGIKTVSSSLENSKVFAPAAQHLEAGLCQPSQLFSKTSKKMGLSAAADFLKAGF